ncbi:MAG: ATP-binding protein [Candidatus Delongbacteria bacterium]|nr:ATP-binding protein [Candidatus Delongbacteria bacterium]MCG2760141.1 ATP-binding protein [Candidatus Delongbacteria bacterium]
MSIEIFQKIILDYQDNSDFDLTERDLPLEFIQNMAIGIVGVRRCGKTYRTHQLADFMKANGKKQNICRIQFNDHRINKIRSEQLNLIDDAYYSLFPEKRNKESVIFIFDEIHLIKGWEDYILYLIESKYHNVLITGSTATLQRGEYSSSLRGKFFPFELSPFSFNEFLRHYGIKITLKTSKGIDLLRNNLKKYLRQGGFPGLLNIPELLHEDILRSYWDTMILRDIAEAHNNDNINLSLLRVFADSLISRTGCPMTVNKLAGNIRESGFAFSNETLYKFLSYLSDAFMIYTVEIYAVSEKIRARNYKKVYCADWALANAVSYGEGIDDTRALENMVFLELRRQRYDINYFRTKEGFEVDFVVSLKKKIISLMQVCYSLENEEVRKREFRALIKTAKYLKVNNLSIITFDEEGSEEIEDFKIGIIPAWKWLLEK